MSFRRWAGGWWERWSGSAWEPALPELPLPAPYVAALGKATAATPNGSPGLYANTSANPVDGGWEDRQLTATEAAVTVGIGDQANGHNYWSFEGSGGDGFTSQVGLAAAVGGRAGAIDIQMQVPASGEAHATIDVFMPDEQTTTPAVRVERSSGAAFVVWPNGRVHIGADVDGTSPPPSVIRIEGLQQFSSNAAALAGGLVAGCLYRNGSSVLVVI